jgi:potassium-dependent mechanosensitive channel
MEEWCLASVLGPSIVRTPSGSEVIVPNGSLISN